MNCENCQAALLDLVYNDLEESLEVEARAHIEQCEACRLSYQKLNEAVSLAVQLPQLEPSERVSEKIRAAAYRKLADSPKRSAVAKTSTQENLRRLVGFVGHLAMGRQVAMAMVMLLIVAFGLHYLPHLRRTPKATGGTVVNPDGSGEAGPSSELTPAKPFDLTVDLPTGRIRSKESAENDDFSKDSVAITEAENAKGTRRESRLPNRRIESARMKKPAIADKFIDEYRVRRSKTGDGIAVSKRASSSDRSDHRDERLMAESARSEIGFANEKENSRGGASISTPTSIAKPESKKKERGVSPSVAGQIDLVDEPMAFPYESQAAPKQVAPRAPTRPVMPTESEMTPITGEMETEESRESIETLYQRGVAQYRSGNYSGAISDLSRVTNRDDARELRPLTLFYLARSYQASGQCSLAVKNFQQLISDFPRHSQTGPAMVEAASCLRRLGKIEQARELLERASLIPSVAEQARRELISLE
jgi:TolA-binding protein